MLSPTTQRLEEFFRLTKASESVAYVPTSAPAATTAPLLHDTIEDTQTTYDELRGQFGPRIAGIVAEVTDTKFLGKRSRKLLQVAKAGRASREAGLVKIADKICNLRDILASPPADWTPARKRVYFDWAKQVVDQVRGVSSVLAAKFGRVWEAGTTSCKMQVVA